MKNKPLQMREFNGTIDYQIYSQWFEDEDLNRQLGPLDQEWLDCVMSESTHQQYSFWNDDQMVAVAGVEKASAEHPYWYITDIAVKPSLRNQGIGAQVLVALFHYLAHPEHQLFRCGVMKSNPLAAQFMEKNGWTEMDASSKDSEDSLMWEYQIFVKPPQAVD